MNGPPFWGPEMEPMGPMGYDFPQQQRGRGNMSMRNMPGPMQMRNMPGMIYIYIKFYNLFYNLNIYLF